MQWVTWEGVGIDRMGCAWLIRRRIDADAQFLFIPYGTSDLPPNAEPFDIPGARLSHHGGHCSFYALLAAYDLHDSVLDRIARMIDEVDTVQEVELEPAAPGIDLLCRGLRRISPDDTTALERGALLYEALYAQVASEGLPSATSIAQPQGDSGQSADPPLRLDPHRTWDRERETPDHDALTRREGEGGAPPLDEST
jgi:hypothetical protein